MHAAAAILGPSGPLAIALGTAFEPRPEQERLAAAVTAAMGARSHLVAEAGTGVGKSFAYLVPAILRCVQNKDIVVVATHTISLQEQLVQKDIPLLHGALARAGIIPEADPPALRPVLVKGRGNYVSIRRLRLASARQESLLADPAARRQLHVIEDWAYQTTDGTRATLPRLERPEVWSHVESDSDNCMGQRCPNYRECFYQRARRAMEAGNLLVCNHALFFADLALRAGGAGFLPRYDHVVLDEAHNVEDAAAEHMGLSLTEGRVGFLLRTLHDPRRGKGYLASLERHPMAVEGSGVRRAIGLTAAAEVGSREFFDQWIDLLDSGKLPGGRVRQPGLVQNTLSPALRELSLALSTLREQATQEQDKFELNSYSRRAADIAAAADAIVGQTLPGCAYWVESQVRGHGVRRVDLACAPIDVAPILREKLFTKECGVVLTSATLATASRPQAAAAAKPAAADDGPSFVPDDEPGPRAAGPSAGGPFAHVGARLGCEAAGTILLGSPFDFARQMEVHVERAAPDPRDGRGQAEYASRLSDLIVKHVAATGGGAFVLFNSFSLLRSLAERLRPVLLPHGYPLLVHEPGSPRTELLQAFRESGRAVLLGAASFWQGVDVRGDALRNVIITQLPFEPPDRPLTEARLEAIRSRGGNPFTEDSLPRAVIRFKQGIGRLIRSRTDTGRIVVLDPRIVTKPYGRTFLDAVPPGARMSRD
ncbi:MAG: ATP-dependent DNA helicase [Phycisphaerales bacterium]|nr:ATP-dependent DNA helicase [Phycisphaerales bacterium]